ncbi:hypothetical protein V6N13_122023 [Hibiscus sabdariffa]
MGDLPKGDVSISSLHIGMLQDVVPSAASDVLIYSYSRSFNGFAAKLTLDEANKIRGKEGVVSVFLSQKKQLHTTRSWEFMGYNKKMKRSVMESDIIVGMLDTGIWPESESFNDTGYGSIPYKWKGSCQNFANFTCNNKIIGARYYLTDGENGPGDFISPRDAEGHGTHTSSTAAGGLVSHASLYGIARGTARGGVPLARIAVYKICWSEGCSDQDILAAFDDAIADGVDIISLSVGSFIPMDYFEDSIAIGAFHAMKNGILTSNSAGNGGPTPASVTNLSPWSLSVAASTIDRKFVAKVKLGNGQIYEGATINIFDLEGKMYPFIYGGDAPNATLGPSASYYSRFCYPGSLNSTLVQGKIVFCEYFTDPGGVMQAGAAGAVFQELGYKDYQFSYPLPLSSVNMNDGRMMLNYLNTTENPTATIFRTTQDNNQFAPFVVTFSSRGPNPITADILKPDLTAPGVDILAAWSEAASVSEEEGDTQTTKYNIISGTSMSCPHATGAAAYVKSFHPTWSPAAIRSALMTTAMPMTSKNNIEAEFAYGAGHINPLQAIDPGLVYDAGEIDYVKFLCGQGYTVKNIQLITGNSSSCSDDTNGTVWDLNYPSFALSSTPGKSITRVFHRTVTNVGPAVSTYSAVVDAPQGLIIQVQPSVLSFEYVGQTQSFVVTVAAELGNSMISGSLIWDDGEHKVKSPIVAYASVHIVYMGDLPKGEFSAVTLHNNMLEEVVGSGASELLLHSYHRSFNGFAAKLTEEEAKKLADKEGVVSVFESQKKELHTTRSWDFIGFSNQSRRTILENDIIVAMLDTGIWPESESFNDKEFGPPPKKWKGTCQSSSNFTCNNKIIGARYYRANGDYGSDDFKSPRDSEGHGSHTSSIAAGAIVSNADLYSFRAGTAHGGVPSARIAVYKICWYDGCNEEDILAAFDDAIADGVDIISLSVGGIIAVDYFSDSIAIGAFHSMKHGILTSNSAGNGGPYYASVVNLSPWSLSVGASTIDRRFQTVVKLGNGKVFKGTSVNTFDLEGKFYPLIWGGDAPKYNGSDSGTCLPDTLDETLVKGKIVLCDYVYFMNGPLLAGAVGALVRDDLFKDFSYTFPLPTSTLELTDGSDVFHYINTTEKPTATILRSTEENDELAPYVVSFSSRGPNILSPDILKPDIVAPGVDILAAWSEATTVTGVEGDKRVVPYNIVSGTSMSCPHATAVAAYVKSFHPTWSPSAIKSALMTTARPMSPETNTDLEFAYGSGDINPSLAIDPGLVYDAGEIDYVKFLCGQGYSTNNLRLITGDKTSCSEATNGSAWDLNYPSFTLASFGSGDYFSHDFHRTVTNVGSPVSTYKAFVNASNELDVVVKPNVLTFKSIGEKQSFVVTVAAKISISHVVSGALVWDDGVHKVYIVYMGDRPNGEFSAEKLHSNILEQALGSGGSCSLLHSYHRSFNGFVAKLTEDDAKKLADMEGVVSVFPSQKKQLHTTRSWDFMGFSRHVNRTRLEGDIIIGMLDTGIWPESESFNDERFGPPPKKWKGTCQESSNFTCNNKIIGGRYYRADKSFGPTDIQSPRDSEGHGSHTSSIAAGALVPGASLYGLGLGTARGGVPSARIAVYKICWADGCPDADILAAFDDAIADGVDIISLSVGGSFAVDYFNDVIAIGAFHSMKNGILTSNSAGNSGPYLATVTNVSPWSLSVAASTIDRKFATEVMLGNGEIYKGLSINTIELKDKIFPLIYGGDAPNTKDGYDSSESRYCWEDSLDKALVAGKIVLCDEVNNGEGAVVAGAIGAIMEGYLDSAFNFPLPVSCLGTDNGTEILNYLNSTRKPTATIFKSIQEKDEQAPYVISFSSRGPNPITNDILKPDLTAPGVDILAAWSQGTTVTGLKGDNRVVPYNIISGTSMSCPHATAAAAYVKSFNPTWSPAAIKSALMTTAVPLSRKTNTDAEFAFGSGHLIPSSALDPGLVYDAGEIDYVKFLCGQGYDTKTLRLVTGDKSSCSKSINGTAWDLNYPSFTLSTTAGKPITRVFHRTVTNVGSGVSVYKARVKAPSGLKIAVEPNVLGFKAVGETKSFVVKIKAKIDTNSANQMVSGSLIWEDGVHLVRSPVVAFAVQEE